MDDDTNLIETELVQERRRLFRILVYCSFVMMATLFLAGVYWMTGPDAYHESLVQQQAEAPRWPDGSPRSDDDWWADPSIAGAPPPESSPSPKPGG